MTNKLQLAIGAVALLAAGPPAHANSLSGLWKTTITLVDCSFKSTIPREPSPPGVASAQFKCGSTATRVFGLGPEYYIGPAVMMSFGIVRRLNASATAGRRAILAGLSARSERDAGARRGRNRR